MRAAIIETPGKIRVGTISDPTPKPDELVIRVGACGICGTDFGWGPVGYVELTCMLLMVTLHWHTILSSQVMSSRAR